MTLENIMNLTETGSLITLMNGSECIYKGINEKLNEKIPLSYFTKEIVTISSRTIKIDGIQLPTLFICFSY